MEIDEGLFMLGLKAAGMRVPYMPTRVGLGTDVLKCNPAIRLVDSPYDDRQWLAMPALPLDAALLHVDLSLIHICAGRVGLRLNPGNTYNDTSDEDLSLIHI